MATGFTLIEVNEFARRWLWMVAGVYSGGLTCRRPAFSAKDTTEVGLRQEKW